MLQIYIVVLTNIGSESKFDEQQNVLPGYLSIS